MPKSKVERSILIKSWFDKCPLEKQNFRIENGKHFCIPCTKLFEWQKISQLLQHVNTPLHLNHVRLSKGCLQKQTLLGAGSNHKSEFHADLCRMLLGANIPLNKLQNPNVKNFITKWVKKPSPCESTIRKYYVQDVFSETMQKIIQDIGEGPIYLQIDETTDSCGRYVANVIVGRLNIDQAPMPHLLTVNELQSTNNATITQTVLDAIGILWPNTSQGEISKRFLILLTDAVPYMIKAGKNLKGIYPNLQHITCLAHGLHRVAETVRSCYKNVDKLIANIKAIFKKTPARVLKYKEMYPNLPLPPEPVITRWGTWLSAAEFLAIHYNELKHVIMSFDEKDAESIKSAHRLFLLPEIINQLAEIRANYTGIVSSITKLEARNLPLSESILTIKSLQASLSTCTSEVAQIINEKFASVLDRNPDFLSICSISNILQGEQPEIELLFSPSQLAAFKYCPLTSVEVERSFSQSKCILTDIRSSFNFENLQKVTICYFNLTAKSN